MRALTYYYHTTLLLLYHPTALLPMGKVLSPVVSLGKVNYYYFVFCVCVSFTILGKMMIYIDVFCFSQ